MKRILCTGFLLLGACRRPQDPTTEPERPSLMVDEEVRRRSSDEEFNRLFDSDAGEVTACFVISHGMYPDGGRFAFRRTCDAGTQ